LSSQIEGPDLGEFVVHEDGHYLSRRRLTMMANWDAIPNPLAASEWFRTVAGGRAVKLVMRELLVASLVAAQIVVLTGSSRSCSTVPPAIRPLGPSTIHRIETRPRPPKVD
jgi:hypothetical protein